jgi:hypothetical protein
MAEREARVRLSMVTGSYLGGLQQVSAATKSMLASTAAMAKTAGLAGLSSMKTTALSMASSLKSALSSAVTFGGIAGLTMGIKKGLDLQATYKNLAFNIERATGQAVRWQDVQSTIENAAGATSRTNGEMADSFAKVFRATGDAKFAADSLKTIGTVATATGAEVDELANVTQLLQRKFGVTSNELPDALTRVIEKADAGGVGLGELGNRFALLAGEAAAAGLTGKEGISQLLGTLTALDSRVGEKSVPGMKRLLETFKAGSADLKALEKTGGVKFEADSTAFDKVRQMLSGKGRTAIEAKLTGEARTVFDELAKPFDDALKNATKAGASQKEATEAGLAAFDAAMNKAGGSALTFERVQKEAATRGQDAQAKMREATNKIVTALSDEKVLNGMKELAVHAPKVAEAFAKVIGWVSKNPLLGGAALVGGRLGLSFAAGSIANLGSQIGSAATGAMSKGAPGIGKAIGAAVPSGVPRPAGGAPGMAPAVATVAAAGAAALVVDQAGKLGKEAGLTGSLLDALPGFKGGKFDSDELMKGMMATATFGAVGGKENTFGSRLGLALGRAGKEVATFDERANLAAKQRAAASGADEMGPEATGTGKRVAEDLEEAGKGGQALAKDLQAVSSAARDATRALKGVGGSGEGSNGLPPAKGNTPGFLGG